jgi:hypothetical protein
MLEDEKRALEATEVKYKVWEPVNGETYYVGLEWGTQYCGAKADDEYVIRGEAHPTKEAAERHHSFLVMLHDLHKFAVEHNEGWKPDWDSDNSEDKFNIEVKDGRISTERWRTFQVSVLPVFKTGALAQKAIDTFGDRLKILFEYYNS